MINLNTIDVNELVLKLSNALFNVLDGEQDHDIKNQTGCTDEDVVEIIEMRKIAREIAWEKKFIPLNLNVPKSLNTTPDGWFRNYGQEPMFEGMNVDFMFFNDKEIHRNLPPACWDWTIRGGGLISSDIQFWRYSK